MHCGVDGGVEQELLVGGEAGVRYSPAQITAVHILAQPPAVLRLVHADAPVVLERRCTDAHMPGEHQGSIVYVFLKETHHLLK